MAKFSWTFRTTFWPLKARVANIGEIREQILSRSIHVLSHDTVNVTLGALV